MFDHEQKTTTQDSALSDELLQLYKEFAAFNDFYACFCDTLAGVVTDNEVIDTRTIEGVNRCCRWMKHRTEEFRARLEAIQKRSRSENHKYTKA